MSPVRSAALALAALCPAAAPVEAGVSNAVDFALRDGGAVIVPAFVEGQGPHRFLVDTGASASVVAQRLADALALVPVARAVVHTSAGTETRAVARVRRVEVGAAGADGLLVSIAGDDLLRAVGRDVVGILGQDFLSRFDFTIDYRRRRLVWDARHAEEGIRLALHPSQGRFLVDLPQGPGAASPRFVPDSGANALVVFEGRDGPRLATRPLPSWAAVENASGGRHTVTLRRVPGLRVGALTLRDQVAAVVSRPDLDPRQGDGLLPLHGFASVTFAHREGYLVVRP